MKACRSGVIAAVLAAASPAWSADLLGNTLTFRRAYPTSTTPFWSNATQTTTALAGASDVIDWYSGPGATGFHLTVDPEATLIRWSLLSESSFGGSASIFDGFVVTGFQNDIASAATLPNLSGLSVLLSLNGPRELQVNLSGNNRITSFSVSVSLVPEPAAAGAMMAGLGVLALRVRRRR